MSDDGFKYLFQEFGFKNVGLLKQKRCLRCEDMHGFSEEKLPGKCFYSSVKDRTTGGNGTKLDGHISDQHYLMCKKVWNEFNVKNMGDYHDHYLKKRCFVIS